jgi:hypothetical protein
MQGMRAIDVVFKLGTLLLLGVAVAALFATRGRFELVPLSGDNSSSLVVAVLDRSSGAVKVYGISGVRSGKDTKMGLLTVNVPSGSMEVREVK